MLRTAKTTLKKHWWGKVIFQLKTDGSDFYFSIALLITIKILPIKCQSNDGINNNVAR